VANGDAGEIQVTKKQRQKATLAEVAAMAEVDVSTVSRVLRGQSEQRIRAETRERILEVAKKLNYRANYTARALRMSRTFTLGIVVPQLDNPVFSAAIRGAENVAAQNGYSLLISHRDPGDAGTTIAKLSQMNRVDGLLVASLDADEVLRSDLAEANVPYVLLNRQLPGTALSVVLDSREAARKATEHLISLGHRRIGHLGGRPGGFNAQERLAGYRIALDAAGISFDPSLVTMGDYTFSAGRDSVKQLAKTDATAIMAATLVSAAGAMAELRLEGWQLPQEMSVIALHDAPFAEMLFPALSTVMMPTEEMGRVAADLLIRKLSGKEAGPVQALPPGRLIVRDSTVAPRSGTRISK